MYKGIVFLLLSAFLFSISTVFVKVITLQSDIPAFEITSCRFLISFLVILIYVRIKRKPLRPKRPDYIIARAILNLTAVSFLLAGVKARLCVRYDAPTLGSLRVGANHPWYNYVGLVFTPDQSPGQVTFRLSLAPVM